ncbi:hypothetical protein LXA54_03150 [Erwinia amylovora]|nr:hypothetical protein [Erwinia amylovora]MBZ2389638.1 hypothetical protein [Erwinia amylovora]MCK8168816.1 hypothetical protein [Erwinia amylovora]MCK8202659.1 hypothetical protein [Erwinia amylovora]MCK8226269.1 hypothetical protein [Erwinia amylovora]MCK8239665.1 hypothetical protein [Erwinia amylovora]
MIKITGIRRKRMSVCGKIVHSQRDRVGTARFHNVTTVSAGQTDRAVLTNIFPRCTGE